MNEEAGFAATLARLRDSGHLDLDDPAFSSPSARDDLRNALHGVQPTPMVLRRLSVLLGMKLADLFVIAGLDVPADLRVIDTAAGRFVPQIVGRASALSRERRQVLRELVAGLESSGAEPLDVAQKPYEEYPPIPAAIPIRLLHNHNLSWMGTAKTLFGLEGIGPFSAATIGGIAHGRVPLSGELVRGIAALLGLPPALLGALADVEISEAAESADTVVAEMAQLIWDLRRLTSAQMQTVHAAATAE